MNRYLGYIAAFESTLTFITWVESVNDYLKMCCGFVSLVVGIYAAIAYRQRIAIDKIKVERERIQLSIERQQHENLKEEYLSKFKSKEK